MVLILCEYNIFYKAYYHPQQLFLGPAEKIKLQGEKLLKSP